MQIAVWPDPASQALGRLAAETVGASPVTVAPYEAWPQLAAGAVDLALVPTLAVLRQPDLFSVVPGTGLAGSASPTLALRLSGPLDRVERIAFDPRFAQEALLAQLVLRESYGASPSFVPIQEGASLPGNLDGALVHAGAATDDGLVLDLGREWADLTSRPMVWGLLAARRDTLNEAAAVALRDAAAEADGRGDLGAFQLSLGGYAHAGLEALTDHLFFTGTLDSVPDVPFLTLPE